MHLNPSSKDGFFIVRHITVRHWIECASLHTLFPMKEQFVEQALLEARPSLSDWYDDDMLRGHFSKEIERNLGRRTCRLVELTRRRAVIVELPTPHETRPLLRTIIKHRTFSITSASELQFLEDEIHGALEPHRIDRLMTFMHGRPLDDATPVDYLVAGLIDELVSPADACIRDLRLVQPDSLDFYDEYRGWYEEFWRRRPHLRDVWVETREDIEECHAQGGVRLIYIGDQLCGMMAAQRRIEYGLRGWRMRERVTAPGRWGQGISTAAFAAFAQSLEHDEDDAVWGNILPENTSSLGSALRLGRRIVGTYYESPRDGAGAQ